jgi:hypothetical protein
MLAIAQRLRACKSMQWMLHVVLQLLQVTILSYWLLSRFCEAHSGKASLDE